MTATANIRWEAAIQNDQAVRAMRQLEQNQKKVENQSRRTGRAMREAGASGMRASSAFSGMAAGLRALGPLAGGLSMFTMGSQMLQGLKQSSELTSQFVTEMTELIGLGDNIDDIDEWRAKVLAWSSAMGVARKDVADLFFAVQSGASNLPERVQNQLLQDAMELNKVYGVELPSALRVLNKTYQIYGDDLRDVSEAQNMIAVTAERGDLTMQQMAESLPDVLPAAKAFGYELEELFGLLVVGTQKGGDVQKTFTGIRNMLLRMGDAAEKGVPLTGELLTDLQTIANIEPDLMKEIFGDRTVANVAGISSAVSQLREEIELLGNLEGDIATEKLAKLFQDPQFMFAETLKSARQAVENRDIMPGTGAAGDIMLDSEIAKVGVSQRLPKWMAWAGAPAAWMEALQKKGVDPLGIGMMRKGVEGALSFFSDEPRSLIATGEQAMLTDMLAAGETGRTKAEAFASSRGIDLAGFEARNNEALVSNTSETNNLLRQLIEALAPEANRRVSRFRNIGNAALNGPAMYGPQRPSNPVLIGPNSTE